jgi:hypothetical protein
LASRKKYLSVENRSGHPGYSFHGLLLGESPCSWFGAESDIASFSGSLAVRLCAADLLFVKN